MTVEELIKELSIYNKKLNVVYKDLTDIYVTDLLIGNELVVTITDEP